VDDPDLFRKFNNQLLETIYPKLLLNGTGSTCVALPHISLLVRIMALQPSKLSKLNIPHDGFGLESNSVFYDHRYFGRFRFLLGIEIHCRMKSASHLVIFKHR